MSTLALLLTQFVSALSQSALLFFLGVGLTLTFGLALVVGEAVRLTWGSDALQVAAPPLLAGVIFLLDEPFPVYRLFLAASGIVVAVAIWQFLERSRLGLLIGFVQVFGNYYAPDFALAFMYLVMLAVLVVRPGGLLGKEA